MLCFNCVLVGAVVTGVQYGGIPSSKLEQCLDCATSCECFVQREIRSYGMDIVKGTLIDETREVETNRATQYTSPVLPLNSHQQQYPTTQHVADLTTFSPRRLLRGTQGLAGY